MPSVADLPVKAEAPPAIIIAVVIVAVIGGADKEIEAVPETTMAAMGSATVESATAVETSAAMGSATATEVAADLHQLAVCRTRLLQCGGAEIAGPRKCRAGGKSKRKGADKSGFDKIALHNSLHLRGMGHHLVKKKVLMEPAKENAISIAVPIEGNSAVLGSGR